MEDADDPYEILGVSKDANRSQIRAAYRKAALRHHPDKQQTSSEQEKQRANVLFAKISNAYEILSDDDKRREYDTGGQQHQFPGSRGFAQQQHDDFHRHFFNHAHFHDPFQVFEQVFREEFGGGGGHRGSSRGDPFFDDSFGGFPSMSGMGMGGFSGMDPFGSRMGGSMFGGGMDSMFNSMNQMSQMMQQSHQQMMDPMHQQQMQFSSSSTSLGGGGGTSVSTSTTTRMINGQTETVTERVVRHADGRVERQVTTSGGGGNQALENGSSGRGRQRRLMGGR